jgi:hypothetical protein
VKRYSQVTIHHWNHRSGNRSTSREFAERNPDDRTMAREVVEVVKQLPPDEAVLIFTFKTKQAKPPDFVSVLKDDLQRAGVDPDAKLADGRDRIVFLTWGRETSLSEFSYCGNVIFAGVLHRSYHDLAGEILGQRRDLLGELSGDEIEDVRRSEVAHRLYQAMSRGACRVVQGAEACRMNVWLPHWDEEVLDLLTKAMPGVQIVDWETVHVAADKASWEEVAETIVNYLGNLSQDVRKRSIQRLKKDCDLKGVSTKHFRKARDEALRRVDGWCLVGGSVAREDF